MNDFSRYTKLILSMEHDLRIVSKYLKIAKEKIAKIENMTRSLDSTDFIIEIIEQITEQFKVPYEKLVSESRTQEYATARHLACYLLYQKGFTFQKIADFFGRHHATVIASCRVAENLLVTDRNFKINYNKIKNKIGF